MDKIKKKILLDQCSTGSKPVCIICKKNNR